MGMTRRMQHTNDPTWAPLLWTAAAGVAIIAAGIACQIVQLVISVRTRDARRTNVADPWNGRTLEWATASPPPAYNFAVLPHVEFEEAYWGMKRRAIKEQALLAEPEYENIEMPRNSATGVVVAFFATLMGFALIWHIWWAVISGALGAFATFVVFAWRDEVEYEIAADVVAVHDRATRATLLSRLVDEDRAS